jgi:hypothetical protein
MPNIVAARSKASLSSLDRMRESWFLMRLEAWVSVCVYFVSVFM